MNAAEWFMAARANAKALEAWRERAERARAALECGAVRYDSAPGGGGAGDPVGDLVGIEAELQAAEELRRRALAAADAALVEVEAEAGALPCDCVRLYHLQGLSWSETARALDVSKPWAIAQAERCFRLIDALGCRLPNFWE